MSLTKDMDTDGKSTLITAADLAGLFTLGDSTNCPIGNYYLLKADGSAISSGDDLNTVVSFKTGTKDVLFDATFEPADKVVRRDVTFKIKA